MEEKLPGRPHPRDTKVIALVSGAHFVSHYYMLVLPPMFPFVRAEYGVSYTELGVAIAAFSVMSAGLQTSAGFLTDRIGALPVLIGGLLLGGVAIGLAGLVPSFWFMVPMFALAGLANTTFHPSDYSILSHSVSPDRMGKAYSIHTFAGMLGYAVAPAAMLVLQKLVGWRGAFLSAAFLGAGMASLVLWGRESMTGPLVGTARPAMERVANGGLRLLFSGPLVRNLIFFFMLAVGAGGLQNYSVVALGTLYGTPVSVANAALSSYLLMVALGVLAGGLVASRTSRHELVAVAGLVAVVAATLAIALVALAPPLLFVAMSTAGLFSGLIMPSRDMIVRSVAPPGSFGKVSALCRPGSILAESLRRCCSDG
jgi:MFS transporter, FSR family, fosmidomycin resistance protein